jgi:hypothetical protein
MFRWRNQSNSGARADKNVRDVIPELRPGSSPGSSPGQARAIRDPGPRRERAIDIGNDGQRQRVGFQTYVPARMSGFAGESKRHRGRGFEEFPEPVSYLLRSGLVSPPNGS